MTHFRIHFVIFLLLISGGAALSAEARAEAKSSEANDDSGASEVKAVFDKKVPTFFSVFKITPHQGNVKELRAHRTNESAYRSGRLEGQ